MNAQEDGRAASVKERPALSSGRTGQEPPSLCVHSSTIRSKSSVSGSRSARFAGRTMLAAVGLGGLLLVIAAAGLAVEYLAGIGGLAIFAALFVVCLMVLAREEGLL